jgi:hypothetical protein
VFDFDLQLRFWRSVSDVMVHGAQAALAATTAMQDQMLAPVAKPQEPALSPVLGMFDPALWLPGGTGLAKAPAIAAFNPFAASPFVPANPFMPSANAFTDVNPWMEIFMRQSVDAWQMTPSAWGSIPQANPAAMLAPFWGWAASPWGFMQMPLTAMMMQAGFPYDVASPSAKAGTAAMDAADAARQQLDNVMAAYRSDGGHAAAQLVTMPWSFAASLLSGEARPDDVQPVKTTPPDAAAATPANVVPIRAA